MPSASKVVFADTRVCEFQTGSDNQTPNSESWTDYLCFADALGRHTPRSALSLSCCTDPSLVQMLSLAFSGPLGSATNILDYFMLTRILLTGHGVDPSPSVECPTQVGRIGLVTRLFGLLWIDPNSYGMERYVQQHSCGSIADEGKATTSRLGDNVIHMPATKLNNLTAKVGFIGLGLMGSRLTRRLNASGWHIRAWNRSPQPAVEIKRDGVAIAPSIADLVAHSDVILSSLSNDAAVRSVYLDKGGVFSAARPGTIILEMSTISPELSRNLHEEARMRGVPFLDVAISGSTPAVDAGSVTLLAGGDEETFEHCVPLFESIAKQWFLIGPGSSGVQMKLVVNLLLGLDMQGIAEAVSLGDHLQIDRKTLLYVLSKTAVVAPAMAGKIRKIENGDYSPEFPLRLMSKDMDLVMDAARGAGADLPAAAITQSLLASNVRAIGDLDLAAIAPIVIGQGTGIEV
jgi:3-hydroxyisobutyrate dehydrogenase